MDKMKMHSTNLAQENILHIRELFPDCVTEAKCDDGNLRFVVDFDKLRQELSESIIEGAQERYHLDWPGKRKALFVANTPIAKTLRPCREESVNFDTTHNLFIEGDNLEVLKLLQETYLGKIKMIYIDPPYNTGGNFIYKDDFAENTENYLKKSNQKDEEGNRLVANVESSGRFHSDWLSMMYPRLKLARNLLCEEGIIVVHIDENEYPNLEKLLSEIYGESNNLGTIVWDKRNPKGEVIGVAQQHELISIYSKNKESFKKNSKLKRPKENAEKMLDFVSKLIKASGCVSQEIRRKYRDWIGEQSFSGGEKAYSLIDDNGEIYQTVSMAAPDRPETRSHRPLIHPTTGKPCPVPAKGWRFPDNSMDALIDQGEVLFGVDESTQPRRKYLLRENIYENVPSLLYYGGNDDTLLANLGISFDNPKPLAVAKRMIQSICNGSDIILDFFAGSSTTAHAVIQLNAEDGNNRKFIMVQVLELCDVKSDAYKAGYKTITEISKERIRQAGKAIVESLQPKTEKKKQENPGLFDNENRSYSVSSSSSLDIGFRVLKVDSSNMKEVYYTPDAIKQTQLQDFADNIKPGRTPEDLLFQVMLDWGVDLSLPIRKVSLQEKTVFFVDDNVLVACFDKGVTEELVKEIVSHKPLGIVFRDDGFASDSVKITVEQVSKQISPGTVVKSI